MKTKTQSLEFDWGRLANALESSLAAPPKNAITASQLAAKMKMSDSGARKLLDDRVRRGEMQKGNFRKQGKAGGWSAHYWWTK